MPRDELASKERSLFSQVVKNYEAKQYKKGIKAADQILRKKPDHGDTIAMKALIINNQGHTDEAFAMAKQALQKSMKSHICWHVYGLLYRSNKNFEEALKAYKSALKLEPDSPQIQKDLAFLQMQIRDYPGYVQSRRAIIQNKTLFRQNWTALAVAQHLAGDLWEAERTLTTFEETLRSPPPKSDIEHAEATLYKNTIIAEMGEIERALDHLNAAAKDNPDRGWVMERKADYLLQLGRMKEAEDAYRALLDRNAEYRRYYEGLVAAKEIDKSDTQALKALYDEYAEKNPRGDAARRIPLDVLTGSGFREAVDSYLQRMLRKGIPSLFANIKALYADMSKRDTIQDLVESYRGGQGIVQMNGTAEKEPKDIEEKEPKDIEEKEPKDIEEKEPKDIEEKQLNGIEQKAEEKDLFKPSVYFFLAQHYNYHLSRNLDKAMENIDEAIKIVPESVDYHLTKARIWKHYGDVQKAAATMEHARTLDTRDRYINTKAAKYQLRNNDNDGAIENMGLFTRKEAAGGPLGDLLDMQCQWFIYEDGISYMRQGKLGLALKRFMSIYSTFETWQEDQYDFHSFSLRKGQIRAYVDMIRWEDHLREHPFFARSAIAAAEIYIKLYDRPELANPMTNGVNGDKNSAEHKKAQKKARKEAEKAALADVQKKDARKPPAVDQNGDPKKEDKDPKGDMLMKTSDPLGDAMKFINPLLEFSPKYPKAQQTAFEVFIRRDKDLLALRSVLASHALDQSDPTTHYQSLRLRHKANLKPPAVPEIALKVFESELSTLVSKDADLSKINNGFLQAHNESARHVQAALRAKVEILDPGSKETSSQDLIRTLALEGSTFEDALGGLEILRRWKADKKYVDTYIAAAHKRYPKATAFQEGQAN